MDDLFVNISEWSYQRFARFYGVLLPHDDLFEDKISKIYDLIMNKHEEDLEFIAKEAGCNYEECILMVRYLKNKRKIGDLFIDYRNKAIKICSIKDEALLSIYVPLIYNFHYQIEQMAPKLPGATITNLESMKEKAYQDIEYLDSKGLLNGIALNKVDKTIIYYAVEKHKNETDFVTINCRNCGAINDVNRHGKSRCAYCGTIVEDN